MNTSCNKAVLGIGAYSIGGKFNNFCRDGLLREVKVWVPNGRDIVEIRNRDVLEVMYAVVIILRKEDVNVLDRDGI